MPRIVAIALYALGYHPTHALVKTNISNFNGVKIVTQRSGGGKAGGGEGEDGLLAVDKNDHFNYLALV